MAETLTDIFDAIVQIQAAITGPSGKKALTLESDEPPAAPPTLPAFYNVEESIMPTQGPARRTLDYTINMHLLFAPASQKYSVRARRAWIIPVMDAFDKQLRLFLSGTPQCHYARIEAVQFEPVSLGNAEYIAATFVLVAKVDSAFAYSSGS